MLKEDEQLIEFTTDRFTLPNLHVTPDKKHIIFDVLGDIYQVSIEGGKAELLLQDEHWKRGAKLSSDGKTLVYVSDESGEFQVWTYDLKNKNKQLFPIKEFIHYPLYGFWGDNNSLFIPSIKGLYNYTKGLNKAEFIQIIEENKNSSMGTLNRRMSLDNSGQYSIYYAENVFWKYEIKNKIKKKIGAPPLKGIITMFRAFENILIYYINDKDDFTKQKLVVWNLDSNDSIVLYENKKNLNFTNLNNSFDFINGKYIILEKEGQIIRLNIETSEYKIIPIEVDVKKTIQKTLHRTPQHIQDSVITAKVLRNPITRKDIDSIYFGAFGKLRAYSKNTGEIKEYYSNKDRFELSPSLSPDGKHLAYTTWNDWEMGHLYIREILTGKETQITAIPGRYINPAWSPDGTEIAFIADPNETKFGIEPQSPGSNTQIFNLDVYLINIFENQKINYSANEKKLIRVTPFSNLPNRFYPTPVYVNKDQIFISSFSKQEKIPEYIQINTTNNEIKTRIPFPYHTDELLISPQGKHIAFIFDNIVWISDFPFKSHLKKKFDKNGQYDIENILLIDSKKIFEIAPSYLYWQDEYTLMWGSAEEIYQYDVRNGKTEKIAEIKVQKPRAIPKTKYALINARIITMNKKDEIIEKGTILVKDNRIEAVGKVMEIIIPKNYKVFDLEGKTIMPGLIDVHAHYHLGPYEFTNQQEYKYIGNLAFGVTTIYDPSVNVLDYKEKSQLIEIGHLLGPRVFASGNIIMNNPINYDYKKLDDLQDAERIIKSMKKLDISGPIKEYSLSNKKKIAFLLHASKKNNYSITTHQVSLQQSLSKIISGYSAVEHLIGGNSAIQKDVIKFIAQSGINYTPTFMVSPGIGNKFANRINMQRNKLLRFNGNLLYYNKHDVFQDKNSKVFSMYNEMQTTKEKELKKEALIVQKIIKEGGKISVGGHGNPLPGISTHLELWALTNNYLLPYEALRLVTINGARKLDLQNEIGSIEKNKLADLIVLENNPLNNILNSLKIRLVIMNGNIFKANNMNKSFPEIKKLNPWPWENEKILKSMESIYREN